jgi:hypothetical protein
LTASRRSDLKHGTNAAYVAGCVCKECRAYIRASGWVGGATDGQPTLTRLYRQRPGRLSEALAVPLSTCCRCHPSSEASHGTAASCLLRSQHRHCWRVLAQAWPPTHPNPTCLAAGGRHPRRDS